MTSYWCEHAWVDGGAVPGVRITVSGGRIAEVAGGQPPRPGDERLSGLVLPGLADAHSHAFHRALRGRTHGGGGSFWTWRQQMYDVAAHLDPDRYLALARAVYAELALGGVTCVGEFHYLHHAPGGQRYDDPNAMSEALVQAAADAGVRLTLLDACYLSGGLTAHGHEPLDRVQRRFSDGDVPAWADRWAALPERPGLLVGAAVHSVRAVPAAALDDVREVLDGRPLHAHVSEQPAENAACQAVYGCTPTELLDRHGLLGPGTTVVHATHVSDRDVALLGGARSAVCACPSTEADLADGIGRFAELRAAGTPVCLGTDQHAHGDLLVEARLLEQLERLRSGQRGRFAPAELVEAATAAGHRSLGWTDAGCLAAGQRADLVAVALDTPRTAGALPHQAVLAASAPDVHTVVVDGQPVVREGRHVLGDVGRLLACAVDAVLEEQ